MQSEIKVFKLINGEEIIAEVEKYEDGVYYLTTPFGIGVNPNTGNLVFVPYLQYTSAAQSMELRNEHVMLSVDPIDSIYNDYLDATRKIAVPRNSIIRSVT